MKYAVSSTVAEKLIDSITIALRSGAVDEWDAPEFEEARRITLESGCVWDFSGWRDTRDTLLFTSVGERRLGGIVIG